MTIPQKVAIYNKLLAGLSKGVKLAALLARQGKTQDRKQVERRNDQLAEQAAKLRRAIHEEWRGQAEKTVEEIRELNGKLQSRIRSIEDTIATADKVVKALGHLDDLIGIAKKVLGSAAS